MKKPIPSASSLSNLAPIFFQSANSFSRLTTEYRKTRRAHFSCQLWMILYPSHQKWLFHQISSLLFVRSACQKWCSNISAPLMMCLWVGCIAKKRLDERVSLLIATLLQLLPTHRRSANLARILGLLRGAHTTQKRRTLIMNLKGKAPPNSWFWFRAALNFFN